MTLHQFYIFLIVMAVIALAVYVSLFFVDAGYGKFYNKKWGPAINNKLGWVLMEAPVFIAMLVLWLCSDRRGDLVRLAFLFLFELHYLQRSFVFPFRLRGKSVMPLSIIVMGVTFNVLNALMQGGWIFYLSPDDYYGADWLTTPKFIAGFLVFIIGMYINIQSDDIIRNLRKNGDSRHYLPKDGMFRYVTSANYFGEVSSGWALQYSPGRGPAPCLPGGPLLTWLPGRIAFMTHIKRSSVPSSTRRKRNVSFPLSGNYGIEDIHSLSDWTRHPA